MNESLSVFQCCLPAMNQDLGHLSFIQMWINRSSLIQKQRLWMQQSISISFKHQQSHVIDVLTTHSQMTTCMKLVNLTGSPY